MYAQAAHSHGFSVAELKKEIIFLKVWTGRVWGPPWAGMGPPLGAIEAPAEELRGGGAKTDVHT